MLLVTIFMCITSCYSKHVAICIEGHCCDTCRVLGDLIQSLLVFAIPDIDHAIATYMTQACLLNCNPRLGLLTVDSGLPACAMRLTGVLLAKPLLWALFGGGSEHFSRRFQCSTLQHEYQK